MTATGTHTHTHPRTHKPSWHTCGESSVSMRTSNNHSPPYKHDSRRPWRHALPPIALPRHSSQDRYAMQHHKSQQTGYLKYLKHWGVQIQHQVPTMLHTELVRRPSTHWAGSSHFWYHRVVDWEPRATSWSAWLIVITIWGLATLTLLQICVSSTQILKLLRASGMQMPQSRSRDLIVWCSMERGSWEFLPACACEIGRDRASQSNSLSQKGFYRSRVGYRRDNVTFDWLRGPVQVWRRFSKVLDSLTHHTVRNPSPNLAWLCKGIFGRSITCRS